MCHNGRVTPGATKKAIKIASFKFTPTHFQKVVHMCMKRQELAEPIGKVRAGKQSSSPETERPDRLQNEVENSLERTSDAGSKGQGELLLTVSQLDVSHPGLHLALFSCCFPSWSVLPLETPFLDHGSLRYSTELCKFYSPKTACIHKTMSRFKAS